MISVGGRNINYAYRNLTSVLNELLYLVTQDSIKSCLSLSPPSYIVVLRVSLQGSVPSWPTTRTRGNSTVRSA